VNPPACATAQCAAKFTTFTTLTMFIIVEKSYLGRDARPDDRGAPKVEKGARMNRHVPYAEFRENPTKYMDEASGDPLHVDDKDWVVLTAQKYEGMLETLHLLRGGNRKELLDAIAEADAGKFTEHELIEE
jgi:PHD/YefM family antitoxin component YafN of YafNO toxin-antitoxin module